jgi:oligogalacturonide lyase
VITKDEVAFAIMGHQAGEPALSLAVAGTAVGGANPGQETDWGPSGTREKPTGLGIVNIRTREMIIIGQTPSGSGLWHVNGSADGTGGPWATIFRGACT